MAYLVRKIQRNKWGNPKTEDSEPIPADAITICLRTYGNTLSVWHIEDKSSANIEKAVLALAGTQQNCDSFSFLVLEETEIRDLGFELVADENTANTFVPGLKKNHRDIVGVNYDSLGRIASHIKERIVRGEDLLVTRKEIKEKLKEAHENGLLDAVIPIKVRKEIGIPVQKCKECSRDLDT